jgi:hypothetical protein
LIEFILPRHTDNPVPRDSGPCSKLLVVVSVNLSYDHTKVALDRLFLIALIYRRRVARDVPRVLNLLKCVAFRLTFFEAFHVGSVKEEHIRRFKDGGKDQVKLVLSKLGQDFIMPQTAKDYASEKIRGHVKNRKPFEGLLLLLELIEVVEVWSANQF